MSYLVSNGLGDSIDAPSVDEMRRFIADVDASDEEHGAAWLATDEGSHLEWNGDGRLVYSCADTQRHLTGVSRERTVTLWQALARTDSRTWNVSPGCPATGTWLLPTSSESSHSQRKRRRRPRYSLQRARAHSMKPTIGDAESTGRK